MAQGIVTLGTSWDLENKATKILKRDRKVRGIKGIAALAEEYSWLTEAQLEERQNKEVYTTIGYPDPNIVEGRVFRAFNPHFGKRPSRLQAADW